MVPLTNDDDKVPIKTQKLTHKLLIPESTPWLVVQCVESIGDQQRRPADGLQDTPVQVSVESTFLECEKVAQQCAEPNFKVKQVAVVN